MSLGINLIYGFPFMSEQERINSVVDSIKYIHENFPEAEIVLFLMSIKDNTIMKLMKDKGFYIPANPWGTLNKYEKKIICAMLNKENISWSKLERSLDMSPATLTKYIKTLQDKGIIKYHDGNYNFEDLMLKTWLNNEKERTGVYPQ